MREIPKKNYAILGVMTIAVVALVYGLMIIYKDNHKVTYDSIVKEEITEVKYNDIDNLLVENPNIVLYIKDSKVDNKKIEKDIKDIIIKNNIQQNIVYIEKNKTIKEKFELKNESPVFVAYKDGKENEVLKGDYSKEDVISFLKRNGVIEND